MIVLKNLWGLFPVFSWVGKAFQESAWEWIGVSFGIVLFVLGLLMCVLQIIAFPINVVIAGLTLLAVVPLVVAMFGVLIHDFLISSKKPSLGRLETISGRILRVWPWCLVSVGFGGLFWLLTDLMSGWYFVGQDSMTVMGGVSILVGMLLLAILVFMVLVGYWMFVSIGVTDMVVQERGFLSSAAKSLGVNGRHLFFSVLYSVLVLLGIAVGSLFFGVGVVVVLPLVMLFSYGFFQLLLRIDGDVFLENIVEPNSK
jgi:hypothetical protein